MSYKAISLHYLEPELQKQVYVQLLTFQLPIAFAFLTANFSVTLRFRFLSFAFSQGWDSIGNLLEAD